MAQVFRQKIVRYYDADGKQCRSDAPDARRETVESSKWYGEYKDGDGHTHRVPLDESKERSRSMLDKLRGDGRMASVGIVKPVDPFADHRTRPLTEHLDDFRRFLIARDNCREHVQKTISQVSTVLSGCKFDTTEDLQPSAVVEFLAELRHQAERPELPKGQATFTTRYLAELLGIKMSSVTRLVRRGYLDAQGTGRKRTYTRDAVQAHLNRRRGIGVNMSNHYLGSIKQFSKWLTKNTRMPYDPLLILERLNEQVDIRRPRRTLSQPDFARLVEMARAGKPFRGLAGGDRALIYVLAAYTGLRCSELGSLKPASFQLDTLPTQVTVAAGYSKHRRQDVLALQRDVAEMVGAYLAGRARADLLWPGSWTDSGAEMLRLDLAAAGIAYVDEGGLVYDFHALRHQFISNLAAAGVHPKAAQDLARHSDIKLTMNVYTHLGLSDQAAALDKLQPPPGAAKKPAAKKARR